MKKLFIILIGICFVIAFAILIYIYNSPIFHFFNGISILPIQLSFFILTALVDYLLMFVYMILLYKYFPKETVFFCIGFCFAMLITYTLKVLINAPRPAAVLGLENIFHIGSVSIQHSFPSGHATSVMALASFLVHISSKKLHSYIFLFVGILGAISRVVLGKHFPIDVLIGSYIGFFVVKAFLLLPNYIVLSKNNIFQKCIIKPFNLLLSFLYIVSLLYIPFLYFSIFTQKYKEIQHILFVILFLCWAVTLIHLVKNIQNRYRH